MAETIQKPKPISGFPEYTPAEQILFDGWLDVIRRTYRLYGFVPIETPAVERRSTLTAKGGIEHEIYGLTRLREDGRDEDTDLALHFDLTVPLARYVAMNEGGLSFPFKRYQIQKVWRGERAQKGRFREFYQCDIDIIGKGSLPLLADAEMPSIIYRIFKEIDIGPFQIRISNRRLAQAFFARRGVSSDKMKLARDILDSLDKVGSLQVTHFLCEQISMTELNARGLIEDLSTSRSIDETLAHLVSLPDGSGLQQGVAELHEVVENIRMLGVPDDAFRVDPLVMRGLDYYTGTVYETSLLRRPGLGSICSGGRYDDLAGFFTNSRLPGVGISIGLTRLFSELKDALIGDQSPSTIAPVLVTMADTQSTQLALQIAERCRQEGLAVETSLQADDLSKVIKYALRRRFSLMIIVGGKNAQNGTVRVKDLRSGKMYQHAPEEVVSTAQHLLQLTE